MCQLYRLTCTSLRILPVLINIKLYQYLFKRFFHICVLSSLFVYTVKSHLKRNILSGKFCIYLIIIREFQV